MITLMMAKFTVGVSVSQHAQYQKDIERVRVPGMIPVECGNSLLNH